MHSLGIHAPIHCKFSNSWNGQAIQLFSKRTRKAINGYAVYNFAMSFEDMSKLYTLWTRVKWSGLACFMNISNIQG